MQKIVSSSCSRFLVHREVVFAPIIVIRDYYPNYSNIINFKLLDIHSLVNTITCYRSNFRAHYCGVKYSKNNTWSRLVVVTKTTDRLLEIGQYLYYRIIQKGTML